MRIVYLFTTFPVLSETFLQREIRAMRELDVNFSIYSLHKGNTEFEGLPVHCFRKWELIKLLWCLPMSMLKHSQALGVIFKALWRQPMPSWLNCGENLLGIAFALIYGPSFRKDKPDLFHGVWATMPASAGMLLREMTGVPYSMGAHAYDVFRHGGDWLLSQKLQTARLIHTTTEATQGTLLEKGATSDQIRLIRRGLHFFPEMKLMEAHRGPFRILSVGRLVEKKGYYKQLKIYKFLKEKGFRFEARIAGEGPLKKPLIDTIRKLDLKKEVVLLGKLDYAGVVEQYEWADAFAFTGIIAQDGDRDGLPNVIPEAMAIGVPVVTSPVAGTCEAIVHKETGFVASPDKPTEWLQVFQALCDDVQTRDKIRLNACKWVHENFDARKNAARLANELRYAAQANPEKRHKWLADL